MGCENAFYPLLISFSVALVTYNVLIFSTTNLRPDFPGQDTVAIVDPVIKMPMDHPLRRGRGGLPKGPLFHTAVTATATVYNTWQCRVMYYWFKKFKDRPGSDMGGFTRILHSGKPDEHMDEIPTFVAQPLPEGMDKGFVVLNRPWAFVQWLEKADIKEDYILMAEPDHIIVRPIPNLARDDLAAAFPFFYIDPKRNERILRRFFPDNERPITDVDPIGNSPVIIKKDSLRTIAPTWLNVSLEMKKDPEADKEFGWVLEMYGYAVASALHGVGNVLHKEFMIQPPWDLVLSNTYIIHYTYGCDYDLTGKATPGKFGEWRFDKRSYTEKPPPRNLAMPPNGVPESVVTLLKMINEATANIPNWGS